MHEKIGASNQRTVGSEPSVKETGIAEWMRGRGVSRARTAYLNPNRGPRRRHFACFRSRDPANSGSKLDEPNESLITRLLSVAFPAEVTHQIAATTRGISICRLFQAVRKLALCDLVVPFVHQWPAVSQRAEVGHLKVASNPFDGPIQECGVIGKNRSVAWSEPFHVAVTNPLKRLDEGLDVAAVVGVDGADATVSIDVVATEQHIADSERELTIGVSRRVPDLELQRTDFDDITVRDLVLNIDRRHRHLEILRFDLRQRYQRVTRLKRFHRVGMCCDCRLQKLFRFCEPLNVINIGVGRNERFALGEREIQLSNDFYKILDGLFVADID